jgi:GYF domain 2
MEDVAMSLKPAVSGQTQSNDSRSSPENPQIDSSFELLEGVDGSQQVSNEESQFWYSKSGASEPIGPVTMGEITKKISSGLIDSDFLLWRSGWKEWARVGDHFEIPGNFGRARTSSLPPPLTRRYGLFTSTQVLAAVGNWQPTVFFLRCVARLTFAFGLLVILLSLVLLPFGMSWFSGGLQIAFIGSILELTAEIRGSLSASAHVSQRKQTGEQKNP